MRRLRQSFSACVIYCCVSATLTAGVRVHLSLSQLFGTASIHDSVGTTSRWSDVYTDVPLPDENHAIPTIRRRDSVIRPTALSALEARKLFTGPEDCASQPCGRYAYCTDYASGHRCTCHLGYFWDGEACVSIEANHQCSPGKPMTLAVQNEYQCNCPPRYSARLRTLPNGASVETCVDVLCSALGDVCYPGECKSTDDGYTCICPQGYARSAGSEGAECETDPCFASPCGEASLHTCTKKGSSYSCSCSPGYYYDGSTCQRATHALCAPGTLGGQASTNGYTCSCPAGYFAESFSVSENVTLQRCAALDVCLNKCSPGNCVSTPSSSSPQQYACECPLGYRVDVNADGEYCRTDPCAISPCGDDSRHTCTSAGDSEYTCECAPGYYFNKTSCHRATDALCYPGRLGQQSPLNEYTCSCPEGYEAVSFEAPGNVTLQKCVAQDVCLNRCASGSCTPSPSTSSGYTCQCNTGYSVRTGKDGGELCELDPCSTAPCGEGSEHVCNSLGGTTYTCRCTPGYFFDGTTCQLATNALCSPGVLGQQAVPNEYTCVCPRGYDVEEYDGVNGVILRRCTAWDVCVDRCEPGTCTATDSSSSPYTCTCPSGYVVEAKDGAEYCKEDPCSTAPCGDGPAQHVCTNTGGPSYSCSCAQGYFFNGRACQLASDEECAPGNLGTQVRPNEYTCSCPDGYFPESFDAPGNVTLQRCKVADECANKCAPGKCSPSPSSQSGYSCTCSVGPVHTAPNGNQYCGDDPCSASPCGAETGHSCMNTGGSSYTCRCARGYFFDGSTCRMATDDLCHPGSLAIQGNPNEYKCSCPAGYLAESFSAPGNVTLQRCAQDNVCLHKCEHGTCTPTSSSSPSYTCTCQAGYTATVGDGGEYCKADPCSTDPCGAKGVGHVCTNTGEASYTCLCASGFFLNGATCQAATDALCDPGRLGETSNPNEYTCICPKGHTAENFSAPGGVTLQRCVSRDPCFERCKPGDCIPTPETPSGYTCDCPPGYSVRTELTEQYCDKDACSTSPCGSGGDHECVDLDGSAYKCACSTGFYFDGSTCQLATDALCAPGRLGTQVGGEYTCLCPSGYTLRLSQVADDVSIPACVPEAVCVDKCGPGHCRPEPQQPSGYECECPTGYSPRSTPNGPECEADPCSTHPCGASDAHSCTNNGGSSYSCDCAPGYFFDRTTCQLATDALCHPGTLAGTASGNQYACSCPEEYYAETFQGPGSVTLQRCTLSVCMNKCAPGRCARDESSPGGYVCECETGYTVETGPGGQYCVADPCSASPCGPGRGHRCTNTGGSNYECACEAGYFFASGRCEVATDALCSPGRLGEQVRPNEYTCVCPPGFLVERFQAPSGVALQRCSADICSNKCRGGTCTPSVSAESGYVCRCPEGFSLAVGTDGEYCKEGPCSGNPCGDPTEGHRCTDTGDSRYSCTCAPGFFFDGMQCTAATDAMCAPGRLGAQVRPNEYTCSCQEGYTPESFQAQDGITLQRCVTDVCFNKCAEGTCTPTPSEESEYTCECNPGYSAVSGEDGEYCEEDPCSLDPCGPSEEGHQCTNNGGSSYTCVCAPGYYFNGTTCRAAVVDLCGPGSAGAEAQGNAYTCVCKEGYMAEDFEAANGVTLQRCVSDPCYNKCEFGSCTRSDAEEFGYTCECNPGYSVALGETGQYCKDDACSLDPCGPREEGHQCTNNQGAGYTCICAAGYYLGASECMRATDALCQPGSLGPQLKPNEYTCLCEEGYTKENFQAGNGVTLQRCVADVCSNKCAGGVCTRTSSGEPGYTCECNPGYSVVSGEDGQYCKEDPCSLDPCGPREEGHLCTNNEDSGYTCVCGSGYYLNGTACTLAHDRLCKPGTLGPQTKPNEYTCLCEEGYTAEDFQAANGITLQRCIADVCFNKCAGGTCTPALSEEGQPGYTCECNPGYSVASSRAGQYCKEDPCSLDPCGAEAEGHQCVNNGGSAYTCVCATGYFMDADTCRPLSDALCAPGRLGTQVRPNEYTCLCEDGYMPEDFQAGNGVTLQRCVADVCFNKCTKGTCTPTPSEESEYACECNAGYSVAAGDDGEYCEEDPCSLDPCGSSEEGHQCTNNGGSSYTCVCASGYYFNGVSCTAVTNSLCSPGSVREHVQGNSYTCVCEEGYMAEDFEAANGVTLQRCVSDPCYNKCEFGSCTRSDAGEFGYTCECNPGYSVALGETGQYCKDDPCSLDPCGPGEEGHQCTSNQGAGYTCICAAGFYLAVTQCTRATHTLCQPGSLGPQLKPNEYTCLCEEGYMPEDFQAENGITLQRCVTDVCFNKCAEGTCTPTPSEESEYTCECNPGYSAVSGEDGEYCEEDPCSLDPCGPSEEGHQCTNNGGSSYTCVCASGYYLNGTTCSAAADDLCAPGRVGTQAQENAYTCVCEEGYMAEDFEAANGVTLQRCVSDPCYNKCEFGSCTRSDAGEFGYTCECNPGYSVALGETGQYCKDDACSLDPCGPREEGHQCTNNQGSGYSCVCAAGFYLAATKCIVATDDLCAPGTLGNQVNPNEYTCSCEEGSIPEDFQAENGITLQRCVTDVCFNKCAEGTCTPTPSEESKYTCECNAGYSVASNDDGEYCEEDPCSLDPCGPSEEGHQCTNNGGSSYTCTCASGYYLDEHSCRAAVDSLCSPGELGGQMKVNEYTCVCPEGYIAEDFAASGDVTLQRCIEDICYGKCQPGKCHRDPSAPGGFTCECPEGYSVGQGAGGEEEACVYDYCGRNACGEPDAVKLCTQIAGGGFSCTCNDGFYYNIFSQQCTREEVCDYGVCGPSYAVESCVSGAPGEYTCTCRQGYSLQETSSGRKCVRTDYCKDNPCGPPEAVQVCVSADNGYTCRCASGYKLVREPLRPYCEAVSGDA